MYRLNGYLAKIGAVKIDTCQCGRGVELVDHFLFKCPPMARAASDSFKKLREKRTDGANYLYALGGWSNEKGKMEGYKAGNQEMISATVKFADCNQQIK